MEGAVIIKACTLLPSILLNLSILPAVLGTMDGQIFPFPVLPDVTFNLHDVIIRPTRATMVSVNATLYNMDDTIICNLTSTKEKEFYVLNDGDRCLDGSIKPGMSLVTSTEAEIYINMFGSKSQIPSIDSMGERYIFPLDNDKQQAGHTKSLLIYSSARNTSVSFCNNRLTDDHLSAKFVSRFQKWFDGTLQCYRANLARDEIWMINNFSLPGGIEVRANNPIGVLRYRVTNTSHSPKNGQFVSDLVARGTPLYWNVYPPLKFWGKHFIVFPQELEDMQNIFVLGTENGLITVNASNNITTFDVQGGKVRILSIPPTSHVTISGTSKMIIYSVECVGNTSRDIYYVAMDGLAKLDHRISEDNANVHILCNESMDTWMMQYLNTSKFQHKESGKAVFGNKTYYFASFPSETFDSLVLVNWTKDQCFQQKTINSHRCNSISYSNTATNNTIKHLWESVKFDNSHSRNVSKHGLIDRRSGVIIGGHINDNVNKSGRENTSDMGLNGYKARDISTRSDVQIVGNQTSISYLLSTIKDETQTETTSAVTEYSPIVKSIIKQSLENSTVVSSSTVTSENYRYLTKSLSNAFTKLLNAPRMTEGYRSSTSTRSGRSSLQDPTGVRKSSSGTVSEIEGNSGSYVTNKTGENISPISPDVDISIHTSSTTKEYSEHNTRMIHNTSNGLLDTTFISSTVVNTLATTAVNSHSTISTDTKHSTTDVNTPSTTHSTRSVNKQSFTAVNKNPTTAISTDGNGSEHKYSNDSISKLKQTEGDKNVSNKIMQTFTKPSKTMTPWSNDRFKVVLDIVSSGNKHTNINAKRQGEKRPPYIHKPDSGGKLNQVGDGKSLVAVIVSLSSALFAVIGIILVFFFMEYFSRRKLIRKTRIRPFLSDF